MLKLNGVFYVYFFWCTFNIYYYNCIELYYLNNQNERHISPQIFPNTKVVLKRKKKSEGLKNKILSNSNHTKKMYKIENMLYLI